MVLRTSIPWIGGMSSVRFLTLVSDFGTQRPIQPINNRRARVTQAGRRLYRRWKPAFVQLSEAAREKISNNRNDALDLFLTQFRENRQAQALTRRLFSDGEVALFVTQMGICLLEVQRQWVMQSTADLIGFEMFFKLVAAWVADHIQMPGALG